MRHRDTASPPLPCACSSLRRATRVVSRHYEAFLAPTGTTATQFSILRLLQCDGPRPLSRIAEALVMERTTLYRALAPLERSGLIRLRDDAADSRARCAVLTRKGAARIRQAMPCWRRAQRSFVDAVGAEDWREIASRLDRIRRRIAGEPSG